MTRSSRSHSSQKRSSNFMADIESKTEPVSRTDWKGIAFLFFLVSGAFCHWASLQGWGETWRYAGHILTGGAAVLAAMGIIAAIVERRSRNSTTDDS